MRQASIGQSLLGRSASSMCVKIHVINITVHDSIGPHDMVVSQQFYLRRWYIQFTYTCTPHCFSFIGVFHAATSYWVGKNISFISTNNLKEFTEDDLAVLRFRKKDRRTYAQRNPVISNSHAIHVRTSASVCLKADCPFHQDEAS